MDITHDRNYAQNPSAFSHFFTKPASRITSGTKAARETKYDWKSNPVSTTLTSVSWANVVDIPA